MGRPDGPIDELIRRAEAGDRSTQAALAQAGRALGVAISVAVNLVDVDTVLLGGIYARLAPWLTAAVEDQLAERVLSAAWAPVRLVVGVLGWGCRRPGCRDAGSPARVGEPRGLDRRSSWFSLRARKCRPGVVSFRNVILEREG